MNDLKGIIEDCNKSDLISDKVIKKIIEIIGQEEWNDLHDENSDICTTMGELIITLKGIPELEKENANLKSIAEFQQSSNMKRHFEIQELKKENAELKSELTKKADTNHSLVEQMAKLESDFRICEHNADTYYDQRTKAKDHIKTLLDCLKQDTNDPQTNYYVCQYMDKAEQFLKEIEK